MHRSIHRMLSSGNCSSSCFIMSETNDNFNFFFSCQAVYQRKARFFIIRRSQGERILSLQPSFFRSSSSTSNIPRQRALPLLFFFWCMYSLVATRLSFAFSSFILGISPIKPRCLPSLIQIGNPTLCQTYLPLHPLTKATIVG